MRSVTIATIIAVVVLALLGAAGCAPRQPMICQHPDIGTTWYAEGNYYQGPERYWVVGSGIIVYSQPLNEPFVCYPIPEGMTHEDLLNVQPRE